MKLKFLLSATLFFHCFNSFSQDGLKSPQGNNGNSNLSMKGCQFGDLHLDYTVSPAADSIITGSSIFHIDTIYISGNDSVTFNSWWNVNECGPMAYIRWYKDYIMIDSVYFPTFTIYAYKTVHQSGIYYAQMTRIAGGIYSNTTLPVVIINTNSTTSISNQTNPNLNVTIIKNKITVKDYLEKDNLLLSVYDLTGRNIFIKEIIRPSSSFEVEIPELSNGLYVLNLKNKNFNFLKKFTGNNF